MFTGIVTQRGSVERHEQRADGSLRLVLRPERVLEGATLGGSVAVDGVCLTLVDLARGLLAFDVIPETLRRTTLGALSVGSGVNLERALRVGDELGGHWVQGHVDGTAEVLSIDRRGAEVGFAFRLPPELVGSVIPKGSVTLDGVSLTVGEVWREGPAECFRVYLIPHTLAVTTLARLSPGARVNVEGDVLGRWVRRILTP